MTERVKITAENYVEYSKAIHEYFMNDMGLRPANIHRIYFLTLALSGEVGELANLVKKLWRDGFRLERLEEIKSEVADVAAYLDHLCGDLGINLEEAKQAKLEELVNDRWPYMFGKV